MCRLRLCLTGCQAGLWVPSYTGPRELPLALAFNLIKPSRHEGDLGNSHSSHSFVPNHQPKDEARGSRVISGLPVVLWPNAHMNVCLQRGDCIQATALSERLYLASGLAAPCTSLFLLLMSVADLEERPQGAWLCAELWGYKRKTLPARVSPSAGQQTN